MLSCYIPNTKTPRPRLSSSEVVEQKKGFLELKVVRMQSFISKKINLNNFANN